MDMEIIAETFLRHLGAEVQRVPVGNQRSADLCVHVEGRRTLVEVKEKHETASWLAHRQQTLEADELFSWQAPTMPNNRLSGVIRDAVDQLTSTANPNCDFRLVWLGAAGPQASAQIEQFRQTLYGLRGFFSIDHPVFLRCYYFSHSAFFTHRESLDGAISARLDENQVRCKLHINSLSKRYAGFCSSALCKSFGDAIEDPIRSTVDDGYLILDADANRAKPEDCTLQLQSAYGFAHLQRTNLGFNVAEVRVASDSLDH